MNLVALMGRLTADTEVRYTADGKAVAKLSLAVNRRFSKENETDFFNCIAFGKTAEFIEKYFKKGMKAVITGELRNNHYTDTNGVKHYSEQIVINNIEFAESKQVKENNAATSFMDIPDNVEDEGLPFN